MNNLISQLNAITLPKIEQKKIYELDVETSDGKPKSYKITSAKFVKNNYGKSVLVYLNEELSTFLPKRYSQAVKDTNDLVNLSFHITSVQDKTVTLHFFEEDEPKVNTPKKLKRKLKN